MFAWYLDVILFFKKLFIFARSKNNALIVKDLIFVYLK